MNRNDFRFGALLVYFVDLCRVTAASASREHREHPWPEANGFSRLGYITLQEHNLHLYINYNYTFTIYITNWSDLAAAFTCPKDQFRRMRRKAVSILAFACNLMMRIPPLSRRQWQCGCRSHWPLLKDSFPTEPIGWDLLWQTMRTSQYLKAPMWHVIVPNYSCLPRECRFESRNPCHWQL